MSVRIGTPASSRTRRSTAGLRSRPGPRNERHGRPVRLVVGRFEDVLHAGALGDVADCERSLDGVRLALDHARAGDEQQRAARADRQAGELDRLHADYPTTDSAGVLTPAASLCCVARLDEPGEQRMRLERLRLELGMELDRDVPGMRRQLDDLDELAVERAADDLQPLVGERFLVQAVELVAVAVPLVDDRFAVELAAPASPASARTHTSRAASCRRGRRRRAGRAACR